jgi:hypothetical protein
MLPRWFFLIFGQGGQYKLHWPQNLAALPKDGAGLASQRGGAATKSLAPTPPGDQKSPLPVGGAARRAATCGQGGGTRPGRAHGALTPRLQAQAGPGWGPSRPAGVWPGSSPTWHPPPGPGPARPCPLGEGVGGWPPPTAVWRSAASHCRGFEAALLYQCCGRL